MREPIIKFLSSFSFFNGVLKTIAVLSCLLFGWLIGDILAGLTGGLTIIMISPSDIPGNRKHHLGGIAIATIFVVISMVSVNLAQNHRIILLGVMFVLIFCYAYISFYGFRASMVAIAGIFSIALTFARLKTGMDIFYSALYALLAGVWYIFLVQVYMWIKPRKYSEQLLGKCMNLTAQLLSTRASLLISENRWEEKQKILNLQTSLNENYEKLREVLLDSRSKSGKTNYLQRQFLIFIELIDIFEWTISNPIAYERLDEYFKNDKKLLHTYADFLNELASILMQMSEYIGFRKKISSDKSIDKEIKRIKQLLKSNDNTRLEVEILPITDEENKVLEQNRIKQQILWQLFYHLERQSRKIENIQHIFTNYYIKESTYRDEKTYRRFVSEKNYSLHRLADHWSLQSPIFRHALRLAIITIIGFLIGDYFSLQNAYWILFTIYVIMRPGYATTRKRTKERTIGSFIGGAIAGIIIYLTQNVIGIENYQMLYGVIIVMCMPIAYGLLQDNFSVSSVFITIYIILIYAIFVEDAMEVLQYRIIDTGIGIVLSIGASYIIFPSWEHRNYTNLAIKMLRMDIEYLNTILCYYKNPVMSITDYKVSRKKAFLALADLNAGYQRMLQEPKFQIKEREKINKFLVLQQDFLSSMTAIGVRLSSEKRIFPYEYFEIAIEQIRISIENHLLILENKDERKQTNTVIFDEIREISLQENEPEYLFYNEQLSYLYDLVNRY